MEAKSDKEDARRSHHKNSANDRSSVRRWFHYSDSFLVLHSPKETNSSCLNLAPGSLLWRNERSPSYVPRVAWAKRASVSGGSRTSPSKWTSSASIFNMGRLAASPLGYGSSPKRAVALAKW